MANDTGVNTPGNHPCDSSLKGNNVFIIVLKEILTVWIPLKIALLLVAIVIAYRLPEIITTLKD
jgi:hypothetical protein